LDSEIGDNADLRGRLEALLAAHDRPPGVLDRALEADLHATSANSVATGDFTPQPAGGPLANGPTQSHQNPNGPPVLDTVIADRYKIRQEIGEGGMGSVYLAEQTQPVKRMVALKLIKPGMDSRTVLARFESERQALALMDHPHIAKVFDAGTTEQGRPFFVMKLVKGIPLTDYCDRHQLDLPTRLAIFRQICSAVQHAHQKGIIHRDLKPTNILVESHDGKPVPKVIDFGLAKATSGMQLSEHSLFTAFGSVTGTPLYMASEQATFNALDVDTRADIYALGVILYELLTGSTPIQRDTMRRAALDEMLRVIREDEPPTPSSRISTSESLPSLAANRHVEPGRLSRMVRGELDWIVMKALAKERDRRYDSAIGMANDVERFLNHEPVSAGPPPTRYRFGKFVRRNRGRVVAAALVLLALVGGIVGTTIGLVEARKQRSIAQAESRKKGEALVAEAAQRLEAETRKKEAERRLAQRDKANAILLSIFTDVNPRIGDKQTLPLSDRLGRNLDAATAALEGDSIDDPMGVAKMQMALGLAQLNLGYAEKAITLFTKEFSTCTVKLGRDQPNTLMSMNNLATSYRVAGRLDLALPLYEETLALQKAKLGPDTPKRS
jgi:eukaryotic-like serine/threonine-protein kinase